MNALNATSSADSSFAPSVESSPKPPPLSSGQVPWPQRLAPYGLALLACGATTVLATPLLDYLDLANIVMLFLLTVLLIAVRLGRGAAVFGSVLSVLLFDVFFVPPRFSLAVENLQYLVTFAVMLATALITGHLAAGLKRKALEAHDREARTRALYDVAQRLAGSLDRAQIAAVAKDFASSQFDADARLALQNDLADATTEFPTAGAGGLLEARLARTARDSGQPVWLDELSGCGRASLYLPLLPLKPLKNAPRHHGVLAISFPPGRSDLSAENLGLLEAFASLLAIAVERLHFADEAQENRLAAKTERLRNSILSALSHDLRTPLTALVGLAESLYLIKPPLPPEALETAQTLSEQAARLASLGTNLLDMARLNAGQLNLRREWQPLEEVIGAAIKLLSGSLKNHVIQVSLPNDLPLLEFDAVLMERVLGNLLENAAKYSPPGAVIEIRAAALADAVSIAVCDCGPGLGSDPDNADLFELFVRGADQRQPGSGLGLAICRSIVEAHGGRIKGKNRPQGGAKLSFTLPRGTPPILEPEPLTADV